MKRIKYTVGGGSYLTPCPYLNRGMIICVGGQVCSNCDHCSYLNVNDCYVECTHPDTNSYATLEDIQEYERIGLPDVALKILKSDSSDLSLGHLNTLGNDLRKKAYEYLDRLFSEGEEEKDE